MKRIIIYKWLYEQGGAWRYIYNLLVYSRLFFYEFIHDNKIHDMDDINKKLLSIWKESKNWRHYRSFKEKVQSMTAKEIIQSMIDGLKAKHIRINMNTFGDFHNNECFGCAATNTVCEISNQKFTLFNISNIDKRSRFLSVDSEFLRNFEYAINELRLGNIIGYNQIAKRSRFATIKADKYYYLPTLTSKNWQSDLVHYQKLADDL